MRLIANIQVANFTLAFLVSIVDSLDWIFAIRRTHEIYTFYKSAFYAHHCCVLCYAKQHDFLCN